MGPGAGLMSEAKECRWCGQFHGPACPIVKAMDLDLYGNVIRVEFLTPADMVRPSPQEPPQPNYPKLGTS